MAKDERNIYTIQNDASIGEIKIADEVVAIIAALAATEVEGVASMAGNITNELISKLGMKNLSKGVKVDVLEGIVTVSLALNLKYNYSIVDVSARVQEKVKNAIENMTGLEVADVNIKVAGVEMESQEYKIEIHCKRQDSCIKSKRKGRKKHKGRKEPTWLEQNFASTFSRCCFRLNLIH